MAKVVKQLVVSRGLGGWAVEANYEPRLRSGQAEVGSMDVAEGYLGLATDPKARSSQLSLQVRLT